MGLLTTTELAGALQVTKGRVSQWVKEQKVAGCYHGEGRARRFDLAKVAAALGKTLEPGQMMGNGAATRSRLKEIRQGGKGAREDDGLNLDAVDEEDAPPGKPVLRDGALLPQADPDRYELARIQKAEEEARRLRRQNQEAEGAFVLASEVEQAVARQMAQEIAEVETVLRDGARAVADRLGVDFKTVRLILVEAWRGHRGQRSQLLAQEANGRPMTAAEQDANF